MMNRNARAFANRAGLTLMELIVVLVGLASIIIPLMPNMLFRTHNATGAVNMQEISKSVQTYQAQYFQYPD
jgi:Tfp pilus assembly protein PilE